MDCKECCRKQAKERRRARYATPEGKEAILNANNRYLTRPDVKDNLSKLKKQQYSTDEKIREKAKENAKEWRIANHARKRKRAAEYYQENKKEINQKLRKKEMEEPWIRLRGRIRSRVCEAIKNAGSLKNGESILKYLPYTITDMCTHLESQFETWMNWSNYGPCGSEKRTWQIDHIIPQSMFRYDSMDSEEFRLCWSLDNLRPLDATQNFTEGNRNDFLHYGSFHELIKALNHWIIDPTTNETSSGIYTGSSKYTLRDACPMSRLGISYLDTIFTKRFHARTLNNVSLIEMSRDPKSVLRVITHLLRKGESITIPSIISNLKFLNRTPGHFFPMASKAIWDKYAISGLPVFDPFLGWGGRTLGAFCANVTKIVGCDLQEDTIFGCNKIALDFTDISHTKSEFHKTDALAFMRSTDESFGAIFSSPPYMDTENYDIESDAMRSGWIESFILPFILECKRILAPNGTLILHLKDLSGAPTFTAYHTALLGSGFRQIATHRYGGSWTQSICVYKIT
ncbi:MAG: hypothetical protein ABFD44_06560 [Anaerolineaceae bacterium]